MIIKASASITLTRVDDGDDGKGIKSIVNKYLASSSGSNVTTATSGLTDSIQTITTGKRYLWNYEVITYTDNSTTTTTPVIIGVYGNTGSTGATGNGISSITEYYLVSPNKSGVTTSTSGWSTTIPTMTATNKYLWNYEVIKYTNSTTSTGTPKVIGIYGDKGDKGDKGETGVGISTVDIEYYLSTSSTAQSGGSWSTTAPTWVDGKYMWSRTKTVTTAGKTTYSNPVCITGGKGNTGATGATGATGKGVSSITEEYYLSTSKTTQTGGSWVTTPPTWSSGKYMWTRSKIVYTNPASTVYTAPVCDSSWEAVNDIQIGTRNLLQGTSKELKSYSTGQYYYRISSGKLSTYNLSDGDTITFRVYIKATTNKGARARISYYYGDGTNYRNSMGNIIPLGSEGYSEITVTLNNPHENGIFVAVNSADTSTTTSAIGQYKEPKLEKGNKATDWSPAPEDIDTRISTAEQKITPEAILNSVNTQISAGGAINTVSTVLDKTGFTVKNGAIKVQNKEGVNVMTSDTYGNLILSGGNMKIQNERGGMTDIAQFFGGSIGAGLSLTSYVTANGNQQSSVSIRLSPDDIDRMEIQAENVAITGNKGGSLSTSNINATVISSGEFWSNGNQILNGSDTWLRTYGNTGWYNGTYGGGWYMTDSTWIRSYNSKNVYVNTILRADGGLQVGNAGSKFNVSSAGAVTAAAESKFSNGGTYSDPWYGTSCAIKASGHIAATGTIRANGVFKLGSTTYGALGYDSSSTDVYVENAANNWLRLKKDMSMTYAGYQVYTAKNFGTIPIVGTRITNLNTRLASGWYSWSSGATGAPASYGVLLVIQWSASADFCQIAVSTGNSMWTRWYVNGSYTGWVAK